MCKTWYDNQILLARFRNKIPGLFQLFGMICYIHFIAYHDCIGENGCDGCINLDDPDNNGLQGIVERLGNLKQNQGFSVGL